MVTPITWRANYAKMRDAFGIDLTASATAADQALQAELAAKIMLKGMVNRPLQSPDSGSTETVGVRHPPSPTGLGCQRVNCWHTSCICSTQGAGQNEKGSNSTFRPGDSSRFAT
jgi:hypothetical protein